MRNARKHTAAFKAKVALDVIRNEGDLAAVAKRHGLHVQQLRRWRKQFLDNAEQIFARECDKASLEDREGELLKKIGELTVERDFLSRGLGRLG